MKPFIVLLAVFVISLLLIKVLQGSYKFDLAGRIAMSAMLIFTAAGHFAFTKGMGMMIPDFIPFRHQIVYLTGLLEILLAAGLLFPAYRIFTAWILIVFLILALPANIYASIHHINYQKADYDGAGISYLWFRIPLQLFFILWIYISSIKY